MKPTSVQRPLYLLARRGFQLGLLVLLIGGNYWGWTALRGNYSSALVLGTVPLSDPLATVQILASGFWVGTQVLIGALIILLGYALIAGRMFCSWVCPVNIITDAARWLARKLQIKGSLRINRSTRYGVLGLSVVLSAVLGVSAFEAISPVAMLHRFLVFGGWSNLVLVAAIFLIDLAVSPNAWCGHLCPIGALYATTGRFALLKIDHSAEKCTKCMDCLTVCPEVQVLGNIGKQSGYITSPACTNCGACIDACADDALHLRLRKHWRTNA